MKKTFADILEREEALKNKKLSTKLPEWAEVEGLEIPSSLSLEQCSSTAAALYKASLASGYGSEIWDLTGGLGVDSWAFSRFFAKVHYNELDKELCDAVSSNFVRLGVSNVEIGCSDCKSLVESIKGDVAYLDPARRSDTGRKVFLIEDCRPDLMTLLPVLLENFRLIMVKLSPMADISMLSKRFSGHLREIHIVGTSEECKELLCLLSEEESDSYKLLVKNLDSGEDFRFCFGDSAPEMALSSGKEIFLVEPRALLMKAGCYDLIGSYFGMRQIDPSTHLYLSDHFVDSSLVKCFRIEEVLEFGKKSFALIKDKYPQAEVTSRNIPITSDELRKRLGVCAGGDFHIFACGAGSKRLIYVTRKCGRSLDEMGTKV